MRKVNSLIPQPETIQPNRMIVCFSAHDNKWQEIGKLLKILILFHMDAMESCLYVFMRSFIPNGLPIPRKILRLLSRTKVSLIQHGAPLFIYRPLLR